MVDILLVAFLATIFVITKADSCENIEFYKGKYRTVYSQFAPLCHEIPHRAHRAEI